MATLPQLPLTEVYTALVGHCAICDHPIVNWRDIGFKDGKMVHIGHKGTNSLREYGTKVDSV